MLGREREMLSKKSTPIALRQKMDEVEESLYEAVFKGLKEGKRDSALKDKEKYKRLYFDCLWRRLTLARHNNPTEAECNQRFLLLNASLRVHLTHFCQIFNIPRENFFTSNKINLFESVIALRHAFAMRRHLLKTSSTWMQKEEFETYLTDMSLRLPFVCERLQDIKQKSAILRYEMSRLSAMSAVLQHHAKERQWCFINQDTMPFNGVYEAGLTLNLSTLLNGLPTRADILDIRNQLKGWRQMTARDLSVKLSGLKAKAERIERVLSFLEAPHQSLYQFNEAQTVDLSNWRRRQLELNRLGEKLDKSYLLQWISFLNKFNHCEWVSAFDRVIASCDSMPNGAAWRRPKMWLEKARAELMSEEADFIQPFYARREWMEEAVIKMTVFHEERNALTQQIASYSRNRITWLKNREIFLTLLHAEADALRTLQLRKRYYVSLFAEKHRYKIAIGATVTTLFSLPFSILFLSLEAPTAFLFTLASLLFGIGVASSLGVAQDQCCPQGEDARPLLSLPVRPHPVYTASTRPSFPAPSWIKPLFPAVDYEEIPDADVEMGQLAGDTASLRL